MFTIWLKWLCVLSLCFQSYTTSSIYRVNRQDFVSDGDAVAYQQSPFENRNGVYRVQRQDFVNANDVPFTDTYHGLGNRFSKLYHGYITNTSRQVPKLFVPATDKPYLAIGLPNYDRVVPASQFENDRRVPSVQELSTVKPGKVYGFNDDALRPISNSDDDSVLPAVSDFSSRVDDEDTSTMVEQFDVSDDKRTICQGKNCASKDDGSEMRPIRRRRSILDDMDWEASDYYDSGRSFFPRSYNNYRPYWYRRPSSYYRPYGWNYYYPQYPQYRWKSHYDSWKPYVFTFNNVGEITTQFVTDMTPKPEPSKPTIADAATTDFDGITTTLTQEELRGDMTSQPEYEDESSPSPTTETLLDEASSPIRINVPTTDNDESTTLTLVKSIDDSFVQDEDDTPSSTTTEAPVWEDQDVETTSSANTEDPTKDSDESTTLTVVESIDDSFNTEDPTTDNDESTTFTVVESIDDSFNTEDPTTDNDESTTLTVVESIDDSFSTEDPTTDNDESITFTVVESIDDSCVQDEDDTPSSTTIEAPVWEDQDVETTSSANTEDPTTDSDETAIFICEEPIDDLFVQDEDDTSLSTTTEAPVWEDQDVETTSSANTEDPTTDSDETTIFICEEPIDDSLVQDEDDTPSPTTTEAPNVVPIDNSVAVQSNGNSDDSAGGNSDTDDYDHINHDSITSTTESITYVFEYISQNEDRDESQQKNFLEYGEEMVSNTSPIVESNVTGITTNDPHSAVVDVSSENPSELENNGNIDATILSSVSDNTVDSFKNVDSDQTLVIKPTSESKKVDVISSQENENVYPIVLQLSKMR